MRTSKNFKIIVSRMKFPTIIPKFKKSNQTTESFSSKFLYLRKKSRLQKKALRVSLLLKNFNYKKIRNTCNSSKMLQIHKKVSCFQGMKKVKNKTKLSGKSSLCKYKTRDNYLKFRQKLKTIQCLVFLKNLRNQMKLLRG